MSLVVAACGLTTRNPNEPSDPSSGVGGADMVSQVPDENPPIPMTVGEGGGPMTAPPETGGAPNAAGGVASEAGGGPSPVGGASDQGGAGASDCATFGAEWQTHRCDTFGGGSAETCTLICNALLEPCDCSDDCCGSCNACRKAELVCKKLCAKNKAQCRKDCLTEGESCGTLAAEYPDCSAPPEP